MSAEQRTLTRAVLRRLPPSLIGGPLDELRPRLLDALERAGCRLPHEPSLEEMKRLLVPLVRAMQPVLPPLRWQAASASPDAPWAGPQGVRPMDILLVEDSLTFARITTRALREGRIPHRLTWLSDGEEALRYLRRRGRHSTAPLPDLILLDLGLPRLDGREVLATLKLYDELRDVPVVVLTASTAEEDRLAAERLQVEGYLVKPVVLSEFLSLVRRLRRFWHADVLLPAGV